MRSIRDAKEIYISLEPPEELDDVVREAVRFAGRKHGAYRHPVCWTACAAGACLVLFVVARNMIPAFAAGISEIPVLGHIAQVLTFAEYEKQGANETLIVRQPELAGTGNTELEKRINQEIQAKINELIATFQSEAKAAKQVYLENGGDESDYLIPEIRIDYRLCCNNGEIVSFVLTKSETSASYYEEQYYYNIDLDTGKELTLRDLLGPQYGGIILSELQRQIGQRMEQDPDAYYYSAEEMETFEVDLENPGFYLNEAGNVVVVYPKYEIAPGYMGIQEFEITR